MKKKIAAVIALVLLICITATGCTEANQVSYKENDLKLRSVGDTLTVSKDRAEHLVRMKIAEVIDSKGGDPESPIEAQG